ncbi:MAG: phosphopantetheine-binding protein [bacterium]
MIELSADSIRDFLLHRFESKLDELGFTASDVPDEFDLLEEGVIDSFGVIEMITALEEEFEVEVDFEDLDPEKFTVLKEFCTYVAAECQRE